MNDLEKAAKILGASFLVGTGIIAGSICCAFPKQFTNDNGAIPTLVAFLGLCLMIRPWTGGGLLDLLRAGGRAIFRMLGLGDPPGSTKPDAGDSAGKPAP